MSEAGTRAVRTWRAHGATLGPLAAWATVALVLLTVQLLANPGGVVSPWPVRGEALRGWVQFDGPEYLSIAASGYEARQLVWFPLYPLLLRAVDVLTGDPVVAGVLVSLLGGATATVLLAAWCRGAGMGTRARRITLGLFLLYPYGWFLYGVVYSDALFVAVALGAFVAAQRDRYVLAGLLGALATATRPSGFAVALGVLLVALEGSGALARAPGRGGWLGALRVPTQIDRARLHPRLLGPLLAWAGLVAYCAYQWVAWGRPLRFVSEQANYHDSGPGTLLKQQYFDAWYGGFDGRHLATTTAQGLLLVGVLLAVPAVGRRFGWGHGVLVLGLAALPAVSVSTFMGIGRYLLPAFPVVALAGEWLAPRPRRAVGVLAVSGALLGLLAYGFSRSWYLT
ncbi:hypothetical protein PO878_15430 [Iamia majanohamensis]|uniref:Glycosyltransferase RgtA/B/C/D-like domain-containing protein n=1 Tax=Iamia majanohamensis TaxID=467976 RepID=A0AAE9Y7T6_9ACTN|nr:hypothetical protein [Iamia majanohamensis]WCO65894.1 hypothetical protein PO878_15430 [Iamia majanohamensis]